MKNLESMIYDARSKLNEQSNKIVDQFTVAPRTLYFRAMHLTKKKIS